MVTAFITIALVIEVIGTSETSANFYETTRHKIPGYIFILAASRA
jgi:hypothetical protein